MSTATELLRRALESWDNNEPNDFNDCMEEIRAFLAAEPEAEPKQYGFINIYKSEGGFRGGHLWATEKEADNNREKNWIYCARIEAAEPEAEPVAWPIDGEIAQRIAEKQCVSYEVVQLIAREILRLHPPRPEPARKPMTEEEINRELPFECSGIYFDGFRDGIDFAEKHHGIGGSDE